MLSGWSCRISVDRHNECDNANLAILLTKLYIYTCSDHNYTQLEICKPLEWLFYHPQGKSDGKAWLHRFLIQSGWLCPLQIFVYLLVICSILATTIQTNLEARSGFAAFGQSLFVQLPQDFCGISTRGVSGYSFGAPYDCQDGFVARTRNFLKRFPLQDHSPNFPCNGYPVAWSVSKK